MTIEQKIEQLADDFASDTKDMQERTTCRETYKWGILAGVALLREELLAQLGEFDREKILAAYRKIPIQFVGNATFDAFYENGARKQHEQMLKAIKGDGDVVD